MATKAAVLARFLLTICRQTTLHKACSVFAHNLSSDGATQSLLGFCCQFAVTLCTQACSVFAHNLSSDSATQGLLGFCCQFVVRQLYAKFARFLLPICCLVMYASLLGFCSQFVVRQCYARFARFLLPICRQTALRKVCSVFAANLSSGYMNTFACILPWICNQNMSSDFVMYLQAFCRHGLMYQNLC